MLSVNMNQDVEKYQESVAAGLNAQQTIAAILALAVSTCVICILYFGFDLPLVIDVYIAIPVYSNHTACTLAGSMDYRSQTGLNRVIREKGLYCFILGKRRL